MHEFKFLVIFWLIGCLDLSVVRSLLRLEIWGLTNMKLLSACFYLLSFLMASLAELLSLKQTYPVLAKRSSDPLFYTTAEVISPNSSKRLVRATASVPLGSPCTKMLFEIFSDFSTFCSSGLFERFSWGKTSSFFPSNSKSFVLLIASLASFSFSY